MAREYTERQQKFLDLLFEEGEGDILKTAKLAGYDKTSTKAVLTSLKDEIIDLCRMHIAGQAPKAILSMGNVLANPIELGNQNLLAAAKEILDRAGLIKQERITIDGNLKGALFILPAKNESSETR